MDCEPKFMRDPGNNSRLPALLRTFVLVLLFLPAHVAFVLLIDLNFLPGEAGETTVGRTEHQGRSKERLRLHLHRQSEARGVDVAVRPAFLVRDLEPWALCSRTPVQSSPGESVSIRLTQPIALEIWLAATPQNHRAPPA
jgi:hypothetical protein